MDESIIEKIKNIEHGKGIQYILDAAGKIFANPILIHDMEYKMVACTGTVKDDPIWSEFIAYGRLLPPTLEFMMHESFVDEVANSTLKNGITLLTSDKLKYNRIFGQLYNKKHEAVADLIMMECDTKFTSSITDEILVLCEVISKELSESSFYNDYGQIYKEGIIKKLIEGTIEDNRLYTGHVANIDSSLKDLYVAVVDLNKTKDIHKQVYYRDLFKDIQPLYDYFIYGEYIIILINCDGNILDDTTPINKLNQLFEKENIYAGVSNRFENLFDLKKYYTQALAALGQCITKKSTRRIYLHPEKGMPGMFI